jgi:hypothetical protein
VPPREGTAGAGFEKPLEPTSHAATITDGSAFARLPAVRHDTGNIVYVLSAFAALRIPSHLLAQLRRDSLHQPAVFQGECEREGWFTEP